MKIIQISRLTDSSEVLTVQISDVSAKNKVFFKCSLSSITDILINNL